MNVTGAPQRKYAGVMIRRRRQHQARLGHYKRRGLQPARCNAGEVRLFGLIRDAGDSLEVVTSLGANDAHLADGESLKSIYVDDRGELAAHIFERGVSGSGSTGLAWPAP